LAAPPLCVYSKKLRPLLIEAKLPCQPDTVPPDTARQALSPSFRTDLNEKLLKGSCLNAHSASGLGLSHDAE